jgi:alkaline phosphatase D
VRASALTHAVAGLTQGAETRMYMQQRYGRLANFLMLDDRQYRDRQVCNEGDRFGSSTIDPLKCPTWDDPGRTLLGAEQERWLDAQLASTGPGWTIFGQQTLFGQRDFRPGPERSFWNDGWDGYPAARRRVTDALQKHRVLDTVMFGGDVHENWVGHLKADYTKPDSASLGAEFCGTSITSRSGGNQRIAPVLPENPHFIFADAERKGYGVAEFTPQRVTTRLRVVDDVRQRETSISTLASFVMEAGGGKLERA